MALEIPERDRARFSSLLGLKAEELDALYEALEHSQPRVTWRAFIAEVSRRFPAGAKPIVDAIYMLLTLFQVRYAEAWSPNEAAAQLVLAAQESGVPELSHPSAGWEEFRTRLERLLSLDMPVGVTAKASAVKNETPRHVYRVQILTDARPIFMGDVKKNPGAFVITHVLELEHHEDRKTKSWFVSVGPKDLDALEAAIKRARMKEASLRRTLRGTNVPVLESGDSL